MTEKKPEDDKTVQSQDSTDDVQLVGPGDNEMESLHVNGTRQPDCVNWSPTMPAAVSDESILPTTVDTSDDDEPPVVTETSAAAFNSFWKYKEVPKGPKVKQTFELEIPDFSDPAKPLVFTDPVFDKTQQNVVNYGKVRVGEGNDITPNPEKLLRLGTAIQDVHDKRLSLGNNSVEKREKMKLSSRICRMKRTANHEANKIKFAGLQQEIEELCAIINKIKRATGPLGKEWPEETHCPQVAGQTDEYVNKVLEDASSISSVQSHSDTSR